MSHDHTGGEAEVSPPFLLKLITPLIWLGGAISTALILIMLVVTIYAIVMRYALNAPLLWTDEVTGWSLVTIVMLGAAEAYRRGDHIAIDILSDRATGSLRWALALFGDLAVLAFAVILGWSTWDGIAFNRMFGSYTSGHIEIETWYLQTPMLAGAVFLGLVALAKVLGRLGERPIR